MAVELPMIRQPDHAQRGEIGDGTRRRFSDDGNSVSLLRRILERDMRPNQPDETDLILQFAAGQTDALNLLLRPNDRRLVVRANQLLRRYRLDTTTYDGEDAVHETLLDLCLAAREGKFSRIGTSDAFWGLIYSSLHWRILDRWDRDRGESAAGDQGNRDPAGSPDRGK